MASIFAKAKPRVAFNMTPMIDCTFQLIIFFMLTTQMASIVRLDPPDPSSSVAKEMKTNRVVVSVVPYTDREIKDQPERKGQAKRYEIGTAKIDLGDTGKVVALLREARRKTPEDLRNDFAVELRADRDIQYRFIEPILHSLQEAEIVNMRITAVRHGRSSS